MTVTDFYPASTYDGFITYLTVAPFTKTADNTGATISVGDNEVGGVNSKYRSYLEFDTSSLGASATVTSAVLTMRVTAI